MPIMVVVSNRISGKKTPNKNRSITKKNVKKISPFKVSNIQNDNTPNKKNSPNGDKITPAKTLNTPNKNTPNKSKNTANKNKNTSNKIKPTRKKIISKVKENSDEVSEEESDEENDMSFTEDNGNDVDEGMSSEENESSDDVEDDDDEDDDDNNEVNDEEDDENEVESDEDDENEIDDDDDANISTILNTNTLNNKHSPNVNKMTPAKTLNTPNKNTPNKNKNTANKVKPTFKKVISKVEENSDEVSEVESDEEDDVNEGISAEENDVDEGISAEGNDDDEDISAEENESSDVEDDEEEDDDNEVDEDEDVENEIDEDEDVEMEGDDDENDDVEDDDEQEEEKIIMPTKTVKRKITEKDKQMPSKKSKTEVTDDDRDDRTVIVSNVPYMTKNFDIKKFFTKFGQIERVTLTKKKSGTVLSYIVFKNQNSVKKALTANGKIFHGQELQVNVSKYDENKTIFISKLPKVVEEKQIRKIFGECGTITSIRLPKDKYTGIGRGFGYLTFDSDDAVQFARQMDVKIGGRKIRIGRKVGEDVSRSIYIGNLPYDVKETKIEKIFEVCGKIQAVKLLPGCGYIHFETCDAAAAALELENIKLDENEITIEKLTKEILEKHKHNRSHSIQVKCLPHDVQEADVKNLFKDCGEINSIKLFLGHGFVYFETSDAVDAAVQLENLKLGCNKLIIEKNEEQHDERASICVRNLPNDVQETDIENIFKDCGEIESIKLYFRYGYIYFKERDAVDAALQLKNLKIGYNRLIIKKKLRNDHLGRSQLIYVGNLPDDVQKADIWNIFKACGKIISIKLYSGYAFVTFETSHAVYAAGELQFEKPKLGCNELIIERRENIKVRNRSIHVGNLPRDTQEADVKNLFKDCGKIKSIKLFSGHGFVVFETGDAVDAALQLENPKLGCSKLIIEISENIQKKQFVTQEQHDERPSIYVGNLPVDVQEADIANLFKDCGEIESIKLFDHYGFVNFKKSDAVDAALQLKNPKLGYNRLIIKRRKNLQKNQFVTQQKEQHDRKSVYIGNLPGDVQKGDIRNIFKDCGKIELIKLCIGYGYVMFKTSDSVNAALQLENPKLGSNTLIIEKKEVQGRNRSIHVGNLPHDIQEADVKNLFKDCGKIKSIKLFSGHGFVVFETGDAVDAALQLENPKLGCNKLIIKISENLQKKQFVTQPPYNRFRNRSIYVGNLPKDVKVSNIEKIFENCGTIKSLNLHSGYGFIDFDTSDAVDAAIHLRNVVLGHNKLIIKENNMFAKNKFTKAKDRRRY